MPARGPVGETEPVQTPMKRWRGGALLVLVSAVVVVDTIFFTALTPLLPHYVHHYGLSKTEAGILVAAYPVGTLLGALPAGLFATRVGVRATLLTGLVGMSAATLVFGFGGSAVVLDTARFVQGLAGACTWSGGLAWLTSATPPERRGVALGTALGAAFGGSLLGPVLGAVASRIGTGPAFSIATVAAVALMIWSAFVPKPVETERQPLRRTLPALRDPTVLGGMWLTFLAGAAGGVVDVLAPLRMNALGAGPIAIGGAFLGAAGLSTVLSPAIGRMADRTGKTRPIQLCLAISVVVSVLLPIVVPASVLAVVIIGGFAAFGMIFVPAAAMISVGAERWGVHQGLAFGMSNLAWASGQAVGSAASGAIAQASSDLVPFVLLAAAYGLTLLAGRRAAAHLAARLRQAG